jgi:hypothetical protein
MLMGFAASLMLSGRGRVRRAAGMACAALMGASFLGENTTLGPLAHRLVPRTVGANVVARSRGSGPPGVLVVAHFDTVNEGTAFNARWVRFVRAGFYAYAAFPFLAVALSYRGWRWPERAYRLAMLAGASGLIQWLLLGRCNAGANDNGSGVAVALSAAEALGAGGEPPADLWFLFTDGEEAGLSGMQAFIKEHIGDVRSALIVNLESLGSGSLSYFGSEGPLVRFRPPAAFTDKLERCASESGVELQRVGDSALATDALAALARGLSAVTLTRVDSSGLIPGWHYKDYIENLDGEVLEETADFVADLIRFLRSSGPRG